MTVSFETVYAAAAARKGGPSALEALLPGPPKSAASLRRLKDAKALGMLTKGVFRAGFNWRVVERYWPTMTEAFGGFEVGAVATLDEGDVAALLTNPGMIKNRARIEATIHNARWLLDILEEAGSFGRWLAAWPGDEIVGLWQRMSAEGKRLGGTTAQYVLREMGKDTFMLTRSVLGGLAHFGVLDRPTAGKRNQAAAQAAFNAWHHETGRGYGALSRIVACSTDA
ncbi:MAG: DNA-3-methyladenine glycosylase I [Myxococcota bacterium]